MLVLLINVFLILATLTLAPVLFLGVFPIYAWRFIVSKMGTAFKQDFGKILTASSTIFASGNVYRGKPSESIVAHCIFKGRFDVHQFRELFMKRVVKLTNSDNNEHELQNPELQQYVTQWLGFFFWKWDRAFDIRNHIRMYDSASGHKQMQEKLFSASDLAEFGESLICQPFSEERSPWEIILFNNVGSEDDAGAGEPFCGMVLHIHHCMLDGYSLLKLLVTDLGQNAAGAGAASSTRSPKYTISQVVKKLASAPYDIAVAAIEQSDELNEFHLPFSKLSFEANAAISPPISLDKLKHLKINLQKQLKMKNGVSLYGLILTAYAEALRKFLIENQFKMPKKINIGISLPKSKHPSKLRNHFTSCCVRISRFDSTIPILERLHIVEQNILAQKSSMVPDFVFVLVKLVGSLFPWMIRRAKATNQATAALSNLPGPPTAVNVADRPLIHFWPTVGMPGNVGIGCVASTYNGNLRLAVRIDETIVSAKKMSAMCLVEGVINEFRSLELECI